MKIRHTDNEFPVEAEYDTLIFFEIKKILMYLWTDGELNSVW